jgi:polar amino acid transport system substrate-binding protein
MLYARSRRRGALRALTLVLTAPATAFAGRPGLTMATGALPPLTSSPGSVGFLDALAREVFARQGIDATVVRLPVERALMNANAGIEDGDMFRAPGFEQDYPNLVQIPEKVLDFEFVAFATRADLRVAGWGDLAAYSVAYVTGWKIYERNVKAARDITTVRELGQLFPLLASGRADVVLLDRWQGLWLAREAGLTVRPLDPPLARVPMFAYLHRRHEALAAPLAAALVEVKRDGTWQRLYDQILKPLEPAR